MPSSSFTDSFADFLEEYAKAFRDASLGNEQELRFVEIYNTFLRRFEFTMHAFCETEGVSGRPVAAAPAGHAPVAAPEILREGSCPAHHIHVHAGFAVPD